MNRQFSFLCHQNQILYILVVCTVFDHITDDMIKPWLTLLLTKPNEILFVKTSVSNVLLESKIVPQTLKQSLLLRVIKEKDFAKLRSLLEWVETSQLVEWATRNHLLLKARDWQRNIWFETIDSEMRVTMNKIVSWSKSLYHIALSSK